MIRNGDSARQTQAGEKAHLRKLIRERRSLRWHLERVNKQIRAQEARIQSVERPQTAEVREGSTEIKSLAEIGDKFEEFSSKMFDFGKNKNKSKTEDGNGQDYSWPQQDEAAGLVRNNSRGPLKDLVS